MKYSQLGKSGLVVSKLSIGCMLFGGEGEYFGLKYSLGFKEAEQLVSHSIDSGINLFDTANMYNSGKSEEMLGKILGNKRKSVLISSKIGFRVGNEIFNSGISYKHIIEQCEDSLKRLKTDYIDLFSLHIDDPITSIEEIARALENLQSSGKIRYSGISNWQAWRTTSLAQWQKNRGYSPVISAQMHYSLLNRGIEDEFLPMAENYGIGIMAWSPLSGGFLTGKYSRANPKPEDGRLNTFDLHLFDREKGYTIIEKVLEIAKKHNTSATAVSIAWLLSKKYCSSILLGVSKLSQFKDNLDSLEVILSKEEVQLLDDISKEPLKYPGVFVNFQDSQLKEAKVVIQ
jgi:aryl-alcohol dehydrogenase-like predicted oxidoreductase